MLIRPATPADAPHLAATHITCWREAYAGIIPGPYLARLSVTQRADGWRDQLAIPSRENLLGLIDDEIVGFASFGPSRDADADAETGELYGLYLRSRYWDRGHGWSLWDQARSRLAARGYQSITLWVLAANERGRRFYERAGFQLEPGATKSIDRDGVRLPEIRYRLTLASGVLE